MITSKVIIALIAILQSVICAILVKSPKHCFDALDGLPKSEIQKIYNMNLKDIANTHPANDVFNCFLTESRHGDKSIAEQNFDIYKKCNEYKKENFQHIGYKQLDELVSLGLSYSLESYLRDQIKIGSTEGIKTAIIYIQETMNKQIEMSKQYKDYKNGILQKFKPVSLRNLQELQEEPPTEKSVIKSLNVQSEQKVLKSTLSSGIKSLHYHFFIGKIYWLLPLIYAYSTYC